MDENVLKELKTLKGMVLAWKECHLRCPPSYRGEYLAQEFMEEIETHVYPYLRRMYECEYVTDPEAKEFMNFCYGQVEELRNELKETTVQDHTGFWQMLAEE